MDGTVTKSRRVYAEVKTRTGKTQKEGRIRTFLWDNPELRKAYSAASRKRKKAK